MGFSSAQLKMKFLIVCLFAAAYAAPAEVKTVAAPALTYAGYAGYPYAAAAYHPYAYGVAGYPYAHAAYTYGVPTVAATHVVAKRSADAEPEADAYYGHYGYAGYGYAAHPYSYGYRAYRPYGYGYRYGAYWG